MDKTWSNDLLKVLRNLNNFIYCTDSSRNETTPFYICGIRVGILTSKVVLNLKNYPEVFKVCKNSQVCSEEYVTLNDRLKTFDECTNAVEKVLRDMVNQDAHIALRGWRSEYYDVASSPTETPIMKIERAAISMFGIRAYGSHMNGYVNHPVKGMCLWIARRSLSKATFPGKLDNMVAGGKASGIGIFETMVKECQEEAGIPEALARKAVPVGIISYIYEDERGIQPDVQYCFDLEIPHDFVPTIEDGEVHEFKLCSIDEVKRLIVSEDFKPNCAAVTLHFLMRKGYVLPDEGSTNHDASMEIFGTVVFHSSKRCWRSPESLQSADFLPYCVRLTAIESILLRS